MKATTGPTHDHRQHNSAGACLGGERRRLPRRRVPRRLRWRRQRQRRRPATPAARTRTSRAWSASRTTPTKQAKRGGTLKWYSTGDVAALDPMTSAIRRVEPAAAGHLQPLTSSRRATTTARQLEVVPDLAQSWEWSPDGLTLTFKLRQASSGTTRRRSTAAPSTRRTSSSAGTASPQSAPPRRSSPTPPTRTRRCSA